MSYLLDTSADGLKRNYRQHIGTLAALGAAVHAQGIEGSDRPEDLLEHIDMLNCWADLARWVIEPGAPVTEGAIIALKFELAEQQRVLEESASDPNTHPDDIAYNTRYVAMVDHAMALARRDHDGACGAHPLRLVRHEHPLMSVVEGDLGPVLTGQEAIENLMRSLDADLPCISATDPSLSYLRALRAALAVSVPLRQRSRP